MPAFDAPVLYIVACGGRPAADLGPFVVQMQQAWHVCVVATPSAVKFMDLDGLAELTGHAVRYDYKQPSEPDALPLADAFVVAPATFNTINKLAAGASDTLALGLLNEAIGLELPIIAVPTPNTALARHPAFQASVRALRSWGVTLIFDPPRLPLPVPNMGPPAAGLFPWEELIHSVQAVRAALDDRLVGEERPRSAGSENAHSASEPPQVVGHSPLAGSA